MRAVEYVSEELRNLDIAYEMGLDKYEFQKLRKELVNKAKEMERNQIIRAVNHSIMKLDEMRAEAIKQNITIGELYIKMNKDENNDSKNNPRT
jgi:hypothetical protein